jgi:probable F420-dependent oxidoreductase
MKHPFEVGAVFPQTEIGVDPLAIRDFAQTVEALGFTHLVVPEHVVGADLANRPDWNLPYHVDSMFHEPMVLLGYLAAVTKTLILVPGVIILPQRQTVLVAKQAATLDTLANGRLRLGVGTGWNKVEYDALGMPFNGRGARLDEKIALLRRLWTERSLSARGEFHDIVEAGICPLPVQRPIPICVGGNAAVAMKRAARIADRWLPYLPATEAAGKIKEFRDLVRHVGRDPEQVSVENLVTFLGNPPRNIDDIVSDVAAWKHAGAAGVCIATSEIGLAGVEQHLRLYKDLAQRVAHLRVPSGLRSQEDGGGASGLAS